MMTVVNVSKGIHAKKPLASWPYIIDVQTSASWATPTTYGAETIEDARRFASRYADWTIRKWNGQAFWMVEESD